MTSNTAKNFDIPTTDLNSLHYFNNALKLFLDMLL